MNIQFEKLKGNLKTRKYPKSFENWLKSILQTHKVPDYSKMCLQNLEIVLILQKSLKKHIKSLKNIV